MRRRLTSPLDPLHVRYGVEPLPASSCSVLYWWNVLIRISSAELSAAYYPVP